MKREQSKFGVLSKQYGQVELRSEENEQHEKLRVVAQNILDCFDWQPEKEDFLIVTDTKVVKDNPLMLRALEQELEQRGKVAQMKKPGAGQFRTLVTEASPKSATPFGETIGQAMRDRPVLILTSMSRSHSKETGAALRGDAQFTREAMEKVASETMLEDGRLSDKAWAQLKQLAKKNRARLISITKGHNPYEILTKGAVEENVEILRERADHVKELMKDVRRVHITTPLSTDLWLAIRPDLSEVEDGRIDKPGALANYPIGEWSCSPDWEGSNGVVVMDGPTGGNVNQDIVDETGPIRMTIVNGEITKTELVYPERGGRALELWRAYLDSGNNDQNHAYKLAEFGIGTNGKALKNKPRSYWGSSEGEKKYNPQQTTVHFAVGSNGTFGRTPDDPFFNSAQVHCDMVLGLNKGGEVTVECERKDGSKFILIENGKPIGY